MDLRKNTRRPQRYEPEQDYACEMTYVPPPQRPVFAPPFVDFNPNLPPAAFPTLSANPLEGSRAQSGGQGYLENLNPRQPVLSGEEKGEIRIRLFGTMNARYSNGLENPTYVKNLKRMKELGEMTKEERFLKECETSSEEDTSGYQTGPFSKPDPPPAWKDLAVPHQINIIDEFYQDGNFQQVFELLDLTTNAQDNIMQHYNARKTRDVDEDTRIKAVQEEQRQLLLSRVNFSTPIPELAPPISQPRFRAFFDKYLYSNLETDHPTPTNKDNARARIFVGDHGMEELFAGYWSDEPEEDDDVLMDEEEMPAPKAIHGPTMAPPPFISAHQYTKEDQPTGEEAPIKRRIAKMRKPHAKKDV
ncbi:MAG: hypothetical protein M1827_005200 [Pycnora praestabilis]|nr:MAG: hypothetical protein M1827_005200 [Pycnora praestabilis]